MKKIASILLSLALVFALVACSTAPEEIIEDTEAIEEYYAEVEYDEETTADGYGAEQNTEIYEEIAGETYEEYYEEVAEVVEPQEPVQTQAPAPTQQAQTPAPQTQTQTQQPVVEQPAQTSPPAEASYTPLPQNPIVVPNNPEPVFREDLPHHGWNPSLMIPPPPVGDGFGVYDDGRPPSGIM